MIGVANDNLWRKFCAVAGLSAFVDDPKFRTNADRVAHRKETVSHVQIAIAQHSVAYWNDTLAGVGVPCAPIIRLLNCWTIRTLRQAELLSSTSTRSQGG